MFSLPWPTFSVLWRPSQCQRQHQALPLTSLLLITSSITFYDHGHWKFSCPWNFLNNSVNMKLFQYVWVVRAVVTHCCWTTSLSWSTILRFNLSKIIEPSPFITSPVSWMGSSLAYLQAHKYFNLTNLDYLIIQK